MEKSPNTIHQPFPMHNDDLCSHHQDCLHPGQSTTHKHVSVPDSMEKTDGPRAYRLGKEITYRCVTLLILICHSPAAVAHPHIFTHASIRVQFDEKGLTGFKVNWMFDEMFSAMMLMDYDTDGDGQLEGAEKRRLKEEAFDPIRPFGYFTHVKIEKRPFQVKYITNFQCEVINGKLIYRFFIPCHVRAAEHVKSVRFSMYDKEFYTCFLLISQPVGFAGDENIDVTHKVEKNRDEAYYFDQVYPEEIHLKFKKMR